MGHFKLITMVTLSIHCLKRPVFSCEGNGRTNKAVKTSYMTSLLYLFVYCMYYGLCFSQPASKQWRPS
jgi:hypothetical protein